MTNHQVPSSPLLVHTYHGIKLKLGFILGGNQNQDQDAHEDEDGRHQHHERPHLLVALEGQQSLLQQGLEVSAEEVLGAVDALVRGFLAADRRLCVPIGKKCIALCVEK